MILSCFRGRRLGSAVFVWYKQWKGRRWREPSHNARGRCESLHGPSRGECSTSHHLRPFQCLTFFLKSVARLRFGDFCRRRFGDFRLQNWFSSPIRCWEVKHWSSNYNVRQPNIHTYARVLRRMAEHMLSKKFVRPSISHTYW